MLLAFFPAQNQIARNVSVMPPCNFCLGLNSKESVESGNYKVALKQE